jgi:hypothetical protein
VHGARGHGAPIGGQKAQTRPATGDPRDWRGRGRGRREGKLTRRCRRHRSARSRSHRPSCRPPRPNLPDTSKHPSLLAIFSRRRRARRAYRERRRCLDAGGQAHRRRLRAPASGQPTSSAWRRGRLATAGILPQLLPLRLRRRRRTKRRRCRGASETAMRAGASARALFWPLLVGSRLSDSAETAVAALACGACGAWADGTRFGRDGEEGDGSIWRGGRRWPGGCGGESLYKGGGEKEENKEAACDGERREVLALWWAGSIYLPAGVGAVAASSLTGLGSRAGDQCRDEAASDAGNMQGRAASPRLPPPAIGVPGIAAVRSTFKLLGTRFSMTLQPTAAT